MMRGALFAMALAATFAASCGGGTTDLDMSVQLDGGGRDAGPTLDGGGPLGAAFTIVGCATLDVAAASPRCIGTVPLNVTFVPLGVGVTDFLWTFAGGDPSSSRAVTPAVRYEAPGTYDVMLA